MAENRLRVGKKRSRIYNLFDFLDLALFTVCTRKFRTEYSEDPRWHGNPTKSLPKVRAARAAGLGFQVAHLRHFEPLWGLPPRIFRGALRARVFELKALGNPPGPDAP